MREPDKNNVAQLELHLREICNNDVEFIKEFVTLFKKNATRAMAELNQIDPSKSAFELQQVAHKLKSNFLLFKYMEAYSLAKKIENASKREQMLPIIRQLNVLFEEILIEISTLNWDIKL